YLLCYLFIVLLINCYTRSLPVKTNRDLIQMLTRTIKTLTTKTFSTRKLTLLFITLALAPVFAHSVFASEKMQLDLDLSPSGKKVQPTMYGIFFEDINFSADGGLYAELVKNRSFEFDQPMMG